MVQDHGWRAMFAFGAGSLYLIDEIPDAKLWVRYIIPRLTRCVDAMPRDGSISGASYMSPCLYLHELMHYREALLALTGTDILDEEPFGKLTGGIIQLMRKDDHVIHAGFHAMKSWNGGEMFFNRMAQKYDDRRAAWLHDRLASIPDPNCKHFDYADGHYNGILWGFFTHDPSIKPRKPEYKEQLFKHFEDSGLVYYRNDKTDVTFSVMCGPWPAWSSYRKVHTNSDRLKLAPVDGHFIMYLGTSPMLVQADSGYHPRTYLGNCLVVDGKGQYGEIGYPCSIPGWLYRGEQIESVMWDEATGTGLVRLNLKPSYPEEMGMALYYRDFIIAPEKKIICRDHVVFDEPHSLSWYFQSRRSIGIKQVDGLKYRVGDKPRLNITPISPSVELTVKIDETPVIWSYHSLSDWDPYDHVEYKTKEKVSAITIDFLITWEEN